MRRLVWLLAGVLIAAGVGWQAIGWPGRTTTDTSGVLDGPSVIDAGAAETFSAVDAEYTARNIGGGTLTLAHSYSMRRWTIDGFDSVVLACGSVGDDSLYRELKHRHPDVRILGDAFAPRRMVFATRQAWELALALG